MCFSGGAGEEGPDWGRPGIHEQGAEEDPQEIKQEGKQMSHHRSEVKVNPVTSVCDPLKAMKLGVLHYEIACVKDTETDLQTLLVADVSSYMYLQCLNTWV